MGRSSTHGTVESALQLDIGVLIRAGAIRPGVHLGGEIKFSFDDEFAIEFELSALHPLDSWLRLKYTISDYWTGERHDVDDKIYLATSRPHFGGQRWWFATENRRLRKLYLPLGGRRFRSRHAYRLVNASQQEALCERARRQERKLRRRLGGFGGDPMDIPYPEKPRLMRWATYNRLLDKLMAAWRVAERAADERIFAFLARRGAWPP